MARVANRFESGSAVYKCRTCGRNTRSTGRGDNELIRLCAECYDLGGEENSLADSGEFYDSKANVLAMIAAVAEKGGDASVWDDLKAKASV
jgi:DNA-directed RNA polymerase subunit RPC12/RpoP